MRVMGTAARFSCAERLFFVQPQSIKSGRMSLMEWTRHFELFLFDFDGLLVDTERLHYEAYRETCAERGLDLNWDMHEYGRAAYFHASRLKEVLMERFPEALGTDPLWEAFYAEKRERFIQSAKSAKLMPGVEALLKEIAAANKQRVVVTHSTLAMVNSVRANLPELDLIEHWITREDYEGAKPSPDGYNLAIRRYGKEGGRVVGFEDTPKGLEALIATKRALPVLVSPFCELFREVLDRTEGIFHAKSFPELRLDVVDAP